MLDERGVKYRYREYRDEPLSTSEIGDLLVMLNASPRDVLRKGDRVFKELGLSGTEPDAELIRLMSRHPTLLQRPIGILDGKAVVGRPPEALLQLVGIRTD